MSGKIRPRDEVAALVAYDAPEPSAEVILVANENPDNPPQPVLDEIAKIAASLSFNRYPDPRALALCEALARANGVDPASVIVGNGADEILVMACLAFGGAGRTVLTFPPTFSMYDIIGRSTGTKIRSVRRRDDFSVDLARAEEAAAGADIVFLANPNNPTGNLAARSVVEHLARSARDLLVLDEAYCEFAGVTYADMIDDYENVLVLRTFSKAFSMAGLRVGYALGPTEVIGELAKVRLPYNSNAFSQATAVAAMAHRPLFEERIRAIVAERERVAVELSAMTGVEPLPSSANFLLVRVTDAGIVWQSLLDGGVLVRSFPQDATLRDYLRVTIGSRADNDRFLAELKKAMG